MKTPVPEALRPCLRAEVPEAHESPEACNFIKEETLAQAFFREVIENTGTSV